MVRQQGRSGYLLCPGCCIPAQIGPPEKQGKILLSCGRDVLWSPALACWSSQSSDPPRSQVKDQNSPNLMSVRLLLGSLAPQTVRLDKYSCPSEEGDGNVAALIDLSQHRAAAWETL